MLRATITGMLRRVMVVVLLGCLGLTAGLACGTLFASHQPRNHFTAVCSPFAAKRARNTCSPLHPADGVPGAGTRKAYGYYVGGDRGRVHFLPKIIVSAPSGRVPVGGYVLLGLLAGLSAALGFLLPPRSRLTRM